MGRRNMAGEGWGSGTGTMQGQRRWVVIGAALPLGTEEARWGGGGSGTGKTGGAWAVALGQLESAATFPNYFEYFQKRLELIRSMMPFLY
jgi:hypothetical protein